MPKYGLALSGGGFRAALYHLGVVRLLRDVGALQQVTDIASVSGGSVLAAHLALNWERYTGSDEEFDEAALEVVNFIQCDVRNHIVRRLPLQIPLKFLAKLRLWNSRQLTPNAILERYYRDKLYGDRCLHELPKQPMLHILTTNVSSGGMSVFNRDGLHIQQRDKNCETTFRHIDGQMAGIPKVVGASSAFPGFFPPVEINAADLGVSEGQFPTEYFTDGGVYDNLGLRTFSWLKKHDGEFDQVFVSDAGKPFQILTKGALGFIGQMVRASDIAMDRVWQLELEHFYEQKGFVFFPMTARVDLADDPHAMHPVLQAEVQGVRTDLDHFSNLEVITLGMHGYEVARDVCRKKGVFAEEALPDSRPWSVQLPQPEVPTGESGRMSSSEVAPESQLSRELRRSSRRRTWSTVLDWRDWPSYIYAALAFIVVFLAPYQLYRLYETSQRQAAIINAVKQGDDDIHAILELVKIDPTKNWDVATVEEKPEPAIVSYDGFELVEHNRIIDLRHWDPDQESPDLRGFIYLRDRITVKRVASGEGDGILTFQAPVQATRLQFRQPQREYHGVITRVTTPVDYHGSKRTVYEFEYDLSDLRANETAKIEMEVLLDYPHSARAPFVTHTKTGMISVWILFPTDRPYHTYSLLSYPLNGSEPPRLLDPRYEINHPYGALIGWSVVAPEDDHVYECRWKFE